MFAAKIVREIVYIILLLMLFISLCNREVYSVERICSVDCATIATHMGNVPDADETKDKVSEAILKILTFEGTSGIRGKAEVLEEAAPYLALTVADIAQEQGVRKITLGYDTRESSYRIVTKVAMILSHRGIEVDVLHRPIPSPMLSYKIAYENRDADDKSTVAGIMITGSHNPSGDNGFCIRNASGAVMIDSATIKERFLEYWKHKDTSLLIESNANVHYVEDPYAAILNKTIIDNPLIHAIMTYQHTKNISYEGSRVLYDAMDGVGAHVSPLIYEDRMFGFDFKQLNKSGMLVTDNSSFAPMISRGDRKPYPDFDRMQDWMHYLVKYHADWIISNDGDADRHAFLDVGGFIDWNELFLLLLDYCGEIGYLEPYTHIVATHTTTALLTPIADKYDIKLISVPVGFKNISKAIEDIESVKGQYVFAGFEGNGGLVLRFDEYVVDKDGVVANLVYSLIKADSLAKGRLSLREDIKEIYRKHELDENVGFMQEVVVPTNETFKRYNEMLLRQDNIFLGRSINISDSRFIDKDKKFRKFAFNDGSWSIMRASGTEHSKARFYVEAPTAQLRNLLIIDLLEDYYSYFSDHQRKRHAKEMIDYFKNHLYQNFEYGEVNKAMEGLDSIQAGDILSVYLKLMGVDTDGAGPVISHLKAA